MDRREAIIKVYRKHIYIQDVLNEFSFIPQRPSGSGYRMESPVKGKKNFDMAIDLDRNSFTDFYSGAFGDAVQLHFYLSVNQNRSLSSMETLPKDKGADGSYFTYKAKILGVDLGSLSFKKTNLSVGLSEEEKEKRRKEALERAKRNLEPWQPKDLNKVYSKLFNILKMKNNRLVVREFMDRGLEYEEAKATPFVEEPSFEESLEIIKKLPQEYLIKTPGFYNEGDEILLRTNGQNIYCPVKDVNGNLVAIQIRNTDMENNEAPKYYALSSAGRLHGSSPGTPTGFFGDKRQAETVIITEGVIKAYLIHYWTKMPTVFLLGVNSQNQLEDSLKVLKANGMNKILIAFDMDYLVNPNVKNAMDNLKYKLDKLHLSYYQMTWDANYNGLDDYLKYLKDNDSLNKVPERLNYLKNYLDSKRRYENFWG